MRHPYLLAPTNLHGLVAVRKYTIRYTSYGPPPDKLSFILHDVDWIGHVQGLQTEGPAALKPLWTENIESIAQQLHETRAAEDRRCLAPNTAMDGHNDGNSQMQSQYAYSTQVAHPIRARPAADEPQVLGVKRNEPVLAGNTQREDIRQRAPAAGQDRSSNVLELLLIPENGNTFKATRTSPDEFARPAPKASTRTTEPRGSQPLTQLPVMAHEQPTQTQNIGGSKGKGEKSNPSSPNPSRGTKRARGSDADSRTDSEDQDSRRRASSNNLTPKKPEQSVLQRLASECSWMKDFEFTRDTFIVPDKQALILRQKESWHKPLPGHQFREGNLPVDIMQTLHRFADERAAVEGAPHSDEDMEEDPSPENLSFPNSTEEVDSSLQSSVEEVDLSPTSLPIPTQDSVLPSSQVSWPSSPSPVPPQMPGRFGQVLPPDSSFDPLEPMDNQRADSTTGAEISAPISKESSNEKEQSGPPSSPPYEEGPMVLGDEMEMEEFVPQALGEDSVGGASESPQSIVSVSPKPKPKPNPVVQVEQTPILAGKNSHIITNTTSPGPEKQRSSGASKHTSSGSIVYGTYNGLHQSSKQQPVSIVDANPTRPNTIANLQSGPHLAEDVVMVDTTTLEASAMEPSEPLVPPEPTPVSAQLPPVRSSPIHRPNNQTRVPALSPLAFPKDTTTSKSPSLAPVATKRKLDNSPSKRSSRHSKRREIKIVGFGDIAPAAIDPTSALRHHREESFRKFQEGRKSSVGLDSRPQTAIDCENEQKDDAMEVDSRDAASPPAMSPAMSPRHVSLYEDPSPIETARKTITPPLPTSIVSPVTIPQQQLPVASPQSHAQVADPQQPAVTASDAPISSVLDAFKAAYPEYTGNVKHFQGQCNQILKLNAEDKMVPVWQWDDYIIRSKIEYSDYLQECNDEGNDPQPYYRFYKNRMGRPLYMKGIIEGEETLTRALQQLGVQPIISQPPATVKNVLQKEKRSRASLPSAFNKPNVPAKGHTNNVQSNRERPRHSLPAKSQATHTATPHKTNLRTPAQQPASTPAPSALPPTRRPSILSRPSLDGVASSRASSVARDTTESTGDPFRDFYFAQQRMTSHTGSTKVSSTTRNSNGIRKS